MSRAQIKLNRDLHRLALTAPDEEVCGVIIRNHDEFAAVPIRNVAMNTVDGFWLDPVDYSKIASQHIVYGVYHSHPDGSTMSIRDRQLSEASCLPYFLVRAGHDDIEVYRPPIVRVELYGRPFYRGIYDCVTFGADFLWVAGGVQFNLPFLRNSGNPKDTGNDADSFFTGLDYEGFTQIRTPAQVGDIAVTVAMCMRNSGRAVHVRVLAEVKAGHVWSHHEYGMLSGIEKKSPLVWQQEGTTHYYRHPKLK